MPPSAIKSVKDIIFWQYAKIIADSANIGKKNFGFVMAKFKELQTGKIHWSDSIREYVKEHEHPEACIYCGEITKLTLEHILPQSRGGENITDNTVWVCRSCNSGKGAKRLYEWKGLDNKDAHHRIAEGKYLKYLYSLHEKRGTLNVSTVTELCKDCDMRKRCEVEDSVEKLSVYCIEGCFAKTT